MGALHAGHASLLAAARAECDQVVMSLFVNPSQFSSASDLSHYPRDAARDHREAEARGVDLVFAPEASTLYPAGFQTWVDVEELSRGLEGAARPRHFRAVATICLKLFNIVQPRRAYFGQKDAQQAAVITRMVTDLELELEIIVLPTVRDPDGLALSSRNVRLTPAEREIALALPHALKAGVAAWQAGEPASAAASATLAGIDGLEVEYVEEANLDGRRLLLAAITVGTTRLIDNVELQPAITEEEQ